MRTQFWVDLITSIMAISLGNFFRENTIDELGLVLRFIVIFGCFCTYRIMAFIDKCDEVTK